MFGLAGLGNTVYHPADYALLSRHVAPARMSQAFSFHTFAGMLGSAAAPGAVLLMQASTAGAAPFSARRRWASSRPLVLLFTPGGEAHRRAGKPAAAASGPTDWRLLLTAPILVNFVFFLIYAFGELRPAELFGGRARPALRHQPGDRQHRAVRLSAAERARRADRRLDRRPHDPPPLHRGARPVARPQSPRC